jgi:hypothetical protein
VLERAHAAAPWTSKSHFPTPDVQGWECDKGVNLATQQVRGANEPARVAGNYTP